MHPSVEGETGSERGQERCGPPLVSCVMVTARRAEFIHSAIRYFLAQDYPEKELLILYETEADLPRELPRLPGLRVRCVGTGLSIGEKRNLGVREAHRDATIIAQWDDDDWYGPTRLSRQVAPLLSGAADITGLRGGLFFEPAGWRFWACTPALHARMFVEDVAGGTLVYRRAFWEQGARYPATNLREDADFLEEALRRGARLARVPAEDLFLYVRHGHNTWRFDAGAFLAPTGWRRAREPASFRPWRDFYLAWRQSLHAPAEPPPGRPLVSCIMPTFDRPELAARAARYFLRQSYPARELLVVDDGGRPAADVLPRDERIRYLRLEGRRSIGHKRNLACEHSRGEVLVHWDDDDWMAPGWLAAQVDCLKREEADACGLSQLFFYDPVLARAYRYVHPREGRPWVHGGTLCYTRELWRRNPFADTSQGEDLAFLRSPAVKRVVAHAHLNQYVAVLHTRNASARPVLGRRWRPCPEGFLARQALAELRG